MAFYELRQYKVRPGKMQEWLKVMEEEIIPFQVAKGMVITGSFRGEADESVYVWLRRFESEAQREALYKSRIRERPLEKGDRAAHPRPPRPREERRDAHRSDHPFDRAISGKSSGPRPSPASGEGLFILRSRERR
jgi:antibiotic biosynthesis monooxygenase (ABM) superfamily enzyme